MSQAHIFIHSLLPQPPRGNANQICVQSLDLWEPVLFLMNGPEEFEDSQSSPGLGVLRRTHHFQPGVPWGCQCSSARGLIFSMWKSTSLTITQNVLRCRADRWAPGLLLVVTQAASPRGRGENKKTVSWEGWE